LAELPDGMVAISISLPDLAQSVSGKLRQGDIIQLFAVEDNNSFTAVAPPELQYVEVLAATYVDGTDVQDEPAAQDNQGQQNGIASGSQENDTLTTVTLLANEEQAACLAGLEHNATLHAALVVRGDDTAKKAALDAQKEYFATLEAPEDTAEAENDGAAPATTTAAGQNG
jgi:pilus assembly protein CpaB